MTPQDRKVARALLSRNLLTVDQVTEVKEACEASGRPFAELAAEKGFLTPQEAGRLSAAAAPPERSRLWSALLGGVVFVLVLLLILVPFLLEVDFGMSGAHVEEIARSRSESDRKAAEVRAAYERRIVEERRARAARALDEARRTMAFVEERLEEAAAFPDLYQRLTDAVISFSDYLRLNPGDARAHVERARAYEVRGDLPRAVEDLEKAVSLDGKLKPEVGALLEELRAKLPE